MSAGSRGVIGVVGASLAGLSAARALRAQGYDGRVVVIGDEPHAPYDRPPLSKGFLAGTAGRTDLDLLADTPAEGDALDVEWRTGVTATRLDPARRALSLTDGRARETELVVDGLVLATGASPRRPWTAVPAGVHVLRTLDDATALRAELVPGARLVVVGAGFIGAEVASTAHALGLDVTVLEAAAAPLAAVLGTELGAAVAGLHPAHGVRLETGVPVTGFTADADGSTDTAVGTTAAGTGSAAGRVTGVQLADGRTVAADVVLLGLGVTPNVDWLASCGLDLAADAASGVVCDAWGATSLPGVVAVGDCSAWYDPHLGRHRRVEHWTSARERAAVAVSTLLSGGTVRATARAPYFWSEQYGLRLQMCGHADGHDEVVVEAGTLAEHDFLAVYRRAGQPVAVLAAGRGKEFMRWRKQLTQLSVATRADAAVPA